jgi:hypothetical protein
MTRHASLAAALVLLVACTAAAQGRDYIQAHFTDIPNAKPSDFRKATERVYRSPEAASAITIAVER